MNLRINTILFFLLLIGIMYGDRFFSIGFYDNYYVMKWIDLIMALLILITGISLLFSMVKLLRKKEKQPKIEKPLTIT